MSESQSNTNNMSDPATQLAFGPALRLAQPTRRFLVRTAVASAATTALVALVATTSFSPHWGAIYLGAAAWSLAFFGFTVLTLIKLVLEKALVPGLLCMAAKLALLVAALFAIRHFLGAERTVLSGSALVAGISTPLLVAGLRFAGAAMTPARAERGTGQLPGATATAPGDPLGSKV